MHLDSHSTGGWELGLLAEDTAQTRHLSLKLYIVICLQPCLQLVVGFPSHPKSSVIILGTSQKDISWVLVSCSQPCGTHYFLQLELWFSTGYVLSIFLPCQLYDLIPCIKSLSVWNTWSDFWVFWPNTYWRTFISLFSLGHLCQCLCLGPCLLSLFCWVSQSHLFVLFFLFLFLSLFFLF